MKKLLLVMAALLLVAPAFAGNTTAGIKAGLGMYNVTQSGGGESASGDIKMGIMGGAYVGFLMGGGKVAIQPEFLLVQKGTKDTMFDTDVKVNLTYIQIPILLKAYLGQPDAKTKFCAFFGPAIGILMSANVSADGVDDTLDIKDEMNSTELGLIGGFGVDAGKVILDFRADLGLSNTAKDASDDYSAKNVGFGLMLGYAFM